MDTLHHLLEQLPGHALVTFPAQVATAYTPPCLSAPSKHSLHPNTGRYLAPELGKVHHVIFLIPASGSSLTLNITDYIYISSQLGSFKDEDSYKAEKWKLTFGTLIAGYPRNYDDIFKAKSFTNIDKYLGSKKSNLQVLSLRAPAKAS